MNYENRMATWELFLGEICRNINPTREDIIDSLAFLYEQNACSSHRLDALVSVRYMAAYEQAINEYLHPPIDFKQANMKAELIHFGSVFEGLSEILLSQLYKSNRFTVDDYNSWFPKQRAFDLKIDNERLFKKQKSGRLQALTFKGVIDCLKSWNIKANKSDDDLADYLKVIDMLRNERNKVHVNEMVNVSLKHEEYKLVEVREKWVSFIKLIEGLT